MEKGIVFWCTYVLCVAVLFCFVRCTGANFVSSSKCLSAPAIKGGVKHVKVTLTSLIKTMVELGTKAAPPPSSLPPPYTHKSSACPPFFHLADQQHRSCLLIFASDCSVKKVEEEEERQLRIVHCLLSSFFPPSCFSPSC